MKLLLAKLAALAQTKVAVAVLGAVVVAGGGSAVAMAATHGQLTQLGGALAGATHATGTHGTGQEAGQGDQTHVSAEGVLKSCTPATTCGTSIVVLKADGTTVAFSVNSSTRVNGAHANALADLPGVVGSTVQVQGEKQSNGSTLASKITVQGGDTGDQTGPTEVHGIVGTVGGHSFALTTDSGSVTITVTAATKFAGKLSGLAGLHSGASVNVQGVKQPDGTIVATRIEGGN